MFNRACRVVKLCVKAVLRALITVEPYARIGHVRFIGGDGSRELSLPGRSNCLAAKTGDGLAGRARFSEV